MKISWREIRPLVEVLWQMATSEMESKNPPSSVSLTLCKGMVINLLLFIEGKA